MATSYMQSIPYKPRVFHDGAEGQARQARRKMYNSYDGDYDDFFIMKDELNDTLAYADELEHQNSRFRETILNKNERLSELAKQVNNISTERNELRAANDRQRVVLEKIGRFFEIGNIEALPGVIEELQKKCKQLSKDNDRYANDISYYEFQTGKRFDYAVNTLTSVETKADNQAKEIVSLQNKVKELNTKVNTLSGELHRQSSSNYNTKQKNRDLQHEIKKLRSMVAPLKGAITRLMKMLGYVRIK